MYGKLAKYEQKILNTISMTITFDKNAVGFLRNYLHHKQTFEQKLCYLPSTYTVNTNEKMI